jgi:zinc transporter ZupT
MIHGNSSTHFLNIPCHRLPTTYSLSSSSTVSHSPLFTIPRLSFILSKVIQLLIYGLAAAAANVLGGLALFSTSLHRRNTQLLRYLLALGAGFMLAVTLFEILPKTITIWQAMNPGVGDSLASPMILMLTGYLVTQFFEHTIAPHFHLGEEMHCDEHDHEMISPRTAYTAVGGMLIHTFFDGVSIAAASQLDTKVGLLVFLAVFLHKFPEGFTIGSMVLAAGQGRRQALIATSLIGFTTIVGVLAFYLVGSNLGFTVAYALPIAGGVTLYVAASDLIPEVNHHGDRSPWVSLSVFAGVALFFGASQVLHSVLE